METYHEKQGDNMQCGLHAVNNACGYRAYDTTGLHRVGDNIAAELCGGNVQSTMYHALKEQLYNDEGYYSVEVLLKALRSKFAEVQQITNLDRDVFDGGRPDAILLWRRGSGVGHYYVALPASTTRWVVVDSLRARLLPQSDQQLRRRMYRPRVYTVQVVAGTCSSPACHRFDEMHIHQGVSRDQLTQRRTTGKWYWTPPGENTQCPVTVLDEDKNPGPYRAWALRSHSITTRRT